MLLILLNHPNPTYMEPIPHPLNFPTNHALPLTHSYMPLPRIPAFFATCHTPSAQFIPSNAIPLWDITNLKSPIFFVLTIALTHTFCHRPKFTARDTKRSTDTPSVPSPRDHAECRKRYVSSGTEEKEQDEEMGRVGE
jgi:hypothetical protein